MEGDYSGGFISDFLSFVRTGNQNAGAFILNSVYQGLNFAPVGYSVFGDVSLERAEGDIFAAGAALGGPVGQFGSKLLTSRALLSRVDDVVPDKLLGASSPGSVAANARFLEDSGITDPVLRGQIIEAGFQGNLLGADTPVTNARFDKLFVQTVAEGKTFTGRLGNIDTRVATINKAAEFERSGLIPRFEFPVKVGDRMRFVDLVGLDTQTRKPVNLVQFVKENRAGTIIRKDEVTAAQQIEKSLNLKPGSVQLINTSR